MIPQVWQSLHADVQGCDETRFVSSLVCLGHGWSQVWPRVIWLRLRWSAQCVSQWSVSGENLILNCSGVGFYLYFCGRVFTDWRLYFSVQLGQLSLFLRPHHQPAQTLNQNVNKAKKEMKKGKPSLDIFNSFFCHCFCCFLKQDTI